MDAPRQPPLPAGRSCPVPPALMARREARAAGPPAPRCSPQCRPAGRGATAGLSSPAVTTCTAGRHGPARDARPHPHHPHHISTPVPIRIPISIPTLS